MIVEKINRIILVSFGILIITSIIGVFVWWNLLFTIRRHADIKFGNTIIQNINNYYLENGKLPNEDDWETLKRLKIEFNYEVTRPEYHKVDDTVYELCFIDGFDGPYLMWNSVEKKWKIDYFTTSTKNKKEK
jgi:hypothetical protein